MKLSPHLREQLFRFARIAGAAFVVQAATLGTARLGWQALGALALGAAETAYRQVWPAVSVPRQAPPGSP